MKLIKSQQDFFSGLMFTVVGAAFAYGATQYSIGTGARMGPGYFPMLLGIISGLALMNVNIWLAIIVESVFFFIAGLGESIQVPAFYSAASHIREIPSSQALARMNLATSPMIIGAKALMGVLAASVGLVWAMLFPIIAFIASGVVQQMVGKRARYRELNNLTAFPPTGTIAVQVMKD